MLAGLLLLIGPAALGAVLASRGVAATRLGIARTTLLYKMQKLGISRTMNEYR